MKKGKFIISFFILALSICGCGNGSSDLINEYNSVIDNLLSSEGFVMNVDASYQTKIVDETNLEDDLIDVDSNLHQKNELKIDLSEDIPNFSLTTNLFSSKNNDAKETMVISNKGKIISYTKDKDAYIEDLEANNDIDIIDNIKKMLFYIDNDSKEDIVISKMKDDKNTIYNITLSDIKKSGNDHNLLDLNYEILIKKGYIEQIEGSYKTYTKDNDKYQRTDYQCEITIEDTNKIPHISFLEE